jgi:uncharacterized protein YbbC (DUF1343 family)/CubicO group peptidase (beta-lactamase class C family)
VGAVALCVTGGGCAGTPRGIAPGAEVDIPVQPGPREASLDPGATAPGLRLLPPTVAGQIDSAVNEAIAQAKVPGCVVVIGRHDRVLFARAYGSRSILPTQTPMTLDTMFDLASLTKPIATATSILVLVDRGELDLDAPLGKYLPELGQQGRGTLRQVLTHTAGLPVDTPVADYMLGLEEAIRRIALVPVKSAPGAATRYSDVGFILLGEVVRRVTGLELSVFAKQQIFLPLGMRETTFRPPDSLQPRLAPTEKVDGAWLLGQVHDPRARALGGVAGHAGLFSTAEDLTLFSQALLRGGSPLLSRQAFASFTAPHDLPGAVRALGWDVRSPSSTNRGTALSARAFGHGGYTGTSLWVDPTKDLFVLLLSNRVHPSGRGAVNPLAGSIADLAAGAIGRDERVLPSPCRGGDHVAPGLDVLVGEDFERIAGAHVGLLTNASGLSASGERDVDLVHASSRVNLVAVFAPEHGLGSDVDAVVHDGRDARTGLPVFSLYGDTLAPTPQQLAGIDTLVVNLPDVGTRFFTYASTVHRCMEVAARLGLRVVVLDRPNPIDGLHVEGPVLEAGQRSFVNHAALPIRHGMTIGELALMFDAKDHLGTVLDVVRLDGWSRADSWAQTGLAWTPPSPNLRREDEAELYPGIGLLEATNLSVGRGTESPFELIGAPWLDGKNLLSALPVEQLPGVAIEPTTFTPTASRFKGALCAGVHFAIKDHKTFDPIRLGVALAVALHRLYPTVWQVKELEKLLVEPDAYAAILRGATVEEVLSTWSAGLARFKAERMKYLLYGTPDCGSAPL